jgi:hypothetical protein
MWFIVRIEVKPVTPWDDIHHDDRLTFPPANRQFDYHIELSAKEVVFENAALGMARKIGLDMFHEKVPVKRLEDFEIEVTLCQKSIKPWFAPGPG